MLIQDRLLLMDSNGSRHRRTVCEIIRKRVFVLGPSHYVGFTGSALSLCTHIQTPFGDLPIDTQSALKSCSKATQFEAVHRCFKRRRRRGTQSWDAVPISRSCAQSKHSDYTDYGWQHKEHGQDCKWAFIALFPGQWDALCHILWLLSLGKAVPVPISRSGQ